MRSAADTAPNRTRLAELETKRATLEEERKTLTGERDTLQASSQEAIVAMTAGQTNLDKMTKEVEGLRAKVAERAQMLGVSIEELFGLPSSRQNGRRQTKHAKGKQPAKYRGPGGEEWSGRGPAPKWMKPLLIKGKTKADFLIK